MKEETWGSLANGDFSDDHVEPSTYTCEVAGGRVHMKDGVVAGGIFVDFLITKGPQKGKMPSIRIAVPQAEANTFRGQKFWFGKKLAGFNIPDAIPLPWEANGQEEESLEALIDALTGQTVLAELVNGRDQYENRNDIVSSKPLGTPAAKTVEAEPEEEEAEVEEEEEEDPYADYTIADLKAELKELGLPVGGPRSKLVERLSSAGDAPASDSDTDDDPGF